MMNNIRLYNTRYQSDERNCVDKSYNPRKKVAGVLIFVVLMVIVTSKLCLPAKASTTDVKCYKSITISADDTLISIAKDNISDDYDDIDEYIKEIKSINNLKSDKIYCGASLVIPYYASIQ